MRLYPQRLYLQRSVHRDRSPRLLWRHGLVVWCLVFSACWSGSGEFADQGEAGNSASTDGSLPMFASEVEQETLTSSDAIAQTSARRATGQSTNTTQSATGPNERAAFGESLPDAPIGFDAIESGAEPGPLPVGISIARIDVESAPVVAVGVNADATFEVPPVEEVGWYRFGASPGSTGSAVLAAHIAYNGIDGVFRHLVDLEPGDEIEIALDDGSIQRWRIVEAVEYRKEALPDSYFDMTGDPQLVLITCGGSFNTQLRSYESNSVVVAVPA